MGGVFAELGARLEPRSVAAAEGILPPAPEQVVQRVPPPPPAPTPDEVAALGLPPAPRARTDAFGESMRDGMIIIGATPHRLIMFSFDDGPDHRYTPGLLDTLDALEMKAIFFLAARRLEDQTPRARQLADIARDIVRRGHFVGNHTMDHLQLPLLDAQGLADQVSAAEEIFERELGARTWLIRPPGGARSARVDAWLAARGYTEVMWNVGTGDFQVRETEDVVRTFSRVLDRRERDAGERGGIVLLHDIHAWSVEAFPRIVRMLEDRNCDLLEANEELYDFVDDPAIFFAARGEGGASEEAPPAMPERSWLAARQARARERAQSRCERLASR